MVGLPDASVRESRDRVQERHPELRLRVSRRTASRSTSRRPTSARRAPPSICRSRSASSRRRASSSGGEIADVVVLGELSLDGAIQPARGVLPIAAAARRDGLARRAAAARRTPSEAAIVDGLDVLAVSSLAEAVSALEPSRRRVAAASPPPAPCRRPSTTADLADVRGQLLARRALEIACAGGHNLLLVGPPGAGKTMMARRLPGILPPLTFDEALEVTAVHSVAGLLPPGCGLRRRAAVPRAASHDLGRRARRRRLAAAARARSASRTTACCFSTRCSSSTRRARGAAPAARGGHVAIARAARTAVFPARFVLVGAMNPCPCGFAGDPDRECRCTPEQIARYTAGCPGPCATGSISPSTCRRCRLTPRRADGRGTVGRVRARVVAARAPARAVRDGGPSHERGADAGVDGA